MDDNLKTTIKGAPMYIVSLFELMTQLLPTLILWLTFLYGVAQLILVCRQLFKKKEKDENETDDKSGNVD